MLVKVSLTWLNTNSLDKKKRTEKIQQLDAVLFLWSKEGPKVFTKLQAYLMSKLIPRPGPQIISVQERCSEKYDIPSRKELPLWRVRVLEFFPYHLSLLSFLHMQDGEVDSFFQKEGIQQTLYSLGLQDRSKIAKKRIFWAGNKIVSGNSGHQLWDSQ
jgi:hypothetical protein